jgi:transposase
LEGSLIYDKSPDSVAFCKIYEEIARQGKEFVIFVDNASWHTSGYTTKYFKERGSQIILNIPYEPDLNCVECVLSIAKNYFKRIKQQRIVKRQAMNADIMVS